jgi:cation transport ATPase
MRSDPLDVATAITIGRSTRGKMHQNLAWAIGYNSLAIPIAAGIFEPLGFTLSPAIGALACPGQASSSPSMRSHSDACACRVKQTECCPPCRFA